MKKVLSLTLVMVLLLLLSTFNVLAFPFEELSVDSIEDFVAGVNDGTLSNAFAKEEQSEVLVLSGYDDHFELEKVTYSPTEGKYTYVLKSTDSEDTVNVTCWLSERIEDALYGGNSFYEVSLADGQSYFVNEMKKIVMSFDSNPVTISYSGEDFSAYKESFVFKRIDGDDALTPDAALEKGVVGDVDSNGEVTAADALFTLQTAVGKVTPSLKQLLNMSVSSGGEITAADALTILQYAVNKITAFSVELN